MAPALVLVGVTTGAFVSTNMDAFLVLVVNVARAPGSRRAAAAGFVIATVMVLAASWTLAGASRLIPAAHAGLIGLVPLVLGVKQGVDLARRRRRPASPAGAVTTPVPSSRGRLRFGEALVLHLSLSADNLAVYSALLTDTLPPLRPIIAAITLALALVWSALAAATLRIPALSGVLLRWGQRFMPVLLVLVGLYILADTETDVLLPPASANTPATQG
jgi:cadmium resistance protein CadD (predicted permease)